MLANLQHVNKYPPIRFIYAVNYYLPHSVDNVYATTDDEERCRLHVCRSDDAPFANLFIDITNQMMSCGWQTVNKETIPDTRVLLSLSPPSLQLCKCLASTKFSGLRICVNILSLLSCLLR